MRRITALLVLGAIAIAGCDAVTPGQPNADGAPQPGTALRSSSGANDGHEHSNSPVSDNDGEKISPNGMAPGFPLVTIGTILESFLPR